MRLPFVSELFIKQFSAYKLKLKTLKDTAQL